jgi:hypothetical protein
MAVPRPGLSAFTGRNDEERPGTTRLVRALLESGADGSQRVETRLKESAAGFAREARSRRDSPERLVITLKAVFSSLDGRVPSLADASTERGSSSSPVIYGAWYSRVLGWCLDAFYSPNDSHELSDSASPVAHERGD